MIRTLILVVSILFSIQSFCQEWIRIYGQGKDAIGMYIIEDYDKGYNILGMIKDYKYLWLLKTDINGNIIRDKKIGKGSYTVWSRNIERTLDNGYIICGTWTKFNPSFDAFLIKLNSCAEIEWCKTLITPTNYDKGFKIQPTPEGGSGINSIRWIVFIMMINPLICWLMMTDT
jgi:hypothetical protein